MGLWRFDPETVTLFDENSGQHLHFEGAVPERPYWLFRYRDRDIQYPIVVSGWPAEFGPRPWKTWTIDHRASAERWRNETGERLPPYDLWRRADRGVSDALLCWPECDATGPLPWKIVSLGGWFNGQWPRRIVRSRKRPDDWGFEAGGPGPEDPEMRPPTPHSWHYVDVSPVAPGAELLGIEEFAPGLLYYPLGRKLRGFQNAVPHLLRDDGQAAIFPGGMSSYMYRFESYRPNAYFVYIDEDVFFRFETVEFGGAWEFRLHDLKLVGVRALERLRLPTGNGLPESLFRDVRINDRWGQSTGPSQRLWQTVSETLLDAGLAWTGSPSRMLDDPDHLKAMTESGPGDPPPPLEESGIDLGPKARVTVEGGYVGSRFNRTFATEAWLQPET